MARLALALLGPLHVTLDGQPVSGFATDKVRALLAYLAVEAHPHRREALAELLWPDQVAAVARASLRVAINLLRKALGDQAAQPSFLLISRETVQLNPASHVALDVSVFADLCRASQLHAHPAGALCATCVVQLTQAAVLYRGELLQQVVVRDSVAFEEWVTLSRERLHRQALVALGQLADYHEAQAEDEQARQYAWRTLALEPWDEAAHRCLMRVLARSGQRNAALAQYQRCRKVLAEELGVEPSAETTALYRRIQSGPLETALGERTHPDVLSHSNAAAVQMLVAPPTNLPAPLTPLIGRESELGAVGALMRSADVRLVTLTGPGGIGKTRLGLQAAAELGGDFPDGVFFIPLASVADPDRVISTIAHTLGLRETGDRPIASVLAAVLRHKRLLLLLDNLEHLMAAASQLATLLAAAPHVKALVTSRAQLHISGEHELVLPTLALPDPAQIGSPERVAQSSAAVRLFCARAQALKADFELTNDNAQLVAEICRRLDGLPLAIELAAARVKIFPPQALLARLRPALPLLSDGPRDAPARQRALRATIDWSYQLLTAEQQLLFARLSVFVGGCSLEAAEHICALGSNETLDIVAGLTALVSQSLLRQEDTAGEPRFFMLETIREYALECLEASGEAASVQQRHARYFTEFAEMAQPALIGPQQVIWLDRLEPELSNLRVALSWSRTEASHDVTIHLAVALAEFWARRGYLTEGRAWLAAAVSQFEADRSDRLCGNTQLVLQAQALDWVGVIASWQADLVAADLAIRKSLAVCREINYSEGIANALAHLGMLFLMSGDQASGGAFLNEALTLFRELGDTHDIGWCLLFVGTLAYTQGDNRRARELWEESLARFRTRGELMGIGNILNYLGMIALDQGDYRQAGVQLRESLLVLSELGNSWQTGLALDALAGFLAAQGRQQIDTQAYGRLAAKVFGAVETLRETLGAPLMLIYLEHHQRGVAAARALLDEPTFATEWAKGRAMTLEQAIAHALDGAVAHASDFDI
jgi:predicted ATPase/DNA-binding SARP family transcriptional activator